MEKEEKNKLMEKDIKKQVSYLNERLKDKNNFKRNKTQEKLTYVKKLEE